MKLANNTGFPRYSRGLRSQNKPRLTNLWITREDCINIFPCIFKATEIKML